MTDNTVIETVDEETDNLELHTKLCSQRYQQLIHKFDIVDQRLDLIENSLIEIKECLVKNDSDTLKKYLSWAGIIITALLGICIHFIIK